MESAHFTTAMAGFTLLAMQGALSTRFKVRDCFFFPVPLLVWLIMHRKPVLVWLIFARKYLSLFPG